MTKEEIIALVAERAGKTQRETQAFMNALEDVMVAALSAGEDFPIHGVGRIYVKKMKDLGTRQTKTAFIRGIKLLPPRTGRATLRIAPGPRIAHLLTPRGDRSFDTTD